MIKPHLVTLYGETKPLIHWLRKYDIPGPVYYRRIHQGYTVEEALLTPKLSHGGSRWGKNHEKQNDT